MIKIKRNFLTNFPAAVLLVMLCSVPFFAATDDRAPLIHGMRWDMGAAEIKAKEKADGLIDEFEMDHETTISYKSELDEYSVSNAWPMNLTYFLFDGKLYSILCNFLSTNEDLLRSYYRTSGLYYTSLLGQPKLNDGFRNVMAWETNGTVITVFLGPTFMSVRKTMLTIQFDGPEAQDVRLKLERIHNEMFREKESLTNE